MTQAEALYHLQEIDLNITQSQKRLAEIATALSNSQILTDARNQVQSSQNTLTPLQTKVRNLELEIQTNTEKIRSTDERLYSGRVQNPKELQDMQQEIQSLKHRNQELEDVLLEAMLNVENMEAELQQKQATLEQLTAQWENDHQHLLDEQQKLQASVEKFRQQREGALPPITPETLKVYTTLRPRKNNQPVALLIAGSCSVCRVEQDMAIIGEVRKGQKLTYCVSCGRILVYKSG